MGAFYAAFFGAVFGTLAALAAEMVKRRIQHRENEKQKLAHYAKPLWLECRELRYRLHHIVGKLEEGQIEGCLHDLNWRDHHEKNIQWMNGHGYYIVSTEYLFASVSCWIELWERDVVFLPFGDDSVTVKFFRLIEDFKHTISTDTNLWFHYLAGIGQALAEQNGERPIRFSEFVARLNRDETFRDYYEQLFQFLHEVGAGQYTARLRETIVRLEHLKSFLKKHGAVPELAERGSEQPKETAT